MRDDRRKHRILVIDSYPDAAVVTCHALEILGYESFAANTGRGALTTAQCFDPEIVILDLDLPDVSGLDVARALRAQAAEHPLHIAALTGWTRPRDREDAFVAGFDQYVVKPAISRCSSARP